LRPKAITNTGTITIPPPIPTRLLSIPAIAPRHINPIIVKTDIIITILIQYYQFKIVSFVHNIIVFEFGKTIQKIIFAFN
jgi:hypothetical protein